MGRRYSLIARLEEGALAELYKASADGPGVETVLVKLFSPKVSDPAYARALGEIAARTRAIEHPAVLGFNEVGFVGDRLAAVREFVEGVNLGDALRRLMSKEVVIPPTTALYIVAEAAQAVSAAHQQGWSHGAITPGNILLGSDGRVRVADFGALEAMNASEPLAAIAAKGRHAYRAPELKRPGAASPSSDVYSLGAIAYELLTLREVATLRGGGLSTQRDTLLPPSRLDRRLNVRLDPVVMRALDQAANRRYRSASELADALRGLFSILGFAPGSTELARFVKDLFPNEVSIGVLGGPLAVTGSFELKAAPFQVTSEVPVLGLDERAPFTSAELPGAGEGTGPELADDLESWEAPPGPMPSGAPAPRIDTEPSVVRPLAASRGTPSAPQRRGEAARGDGGETPRAACRPRRGERPGNGATAEPVEPAAARGLADDASRTPLDVPQVAAAHTAPPDSSEASRTPVDWHLPPSPPPEPPRHRGVGPAVWAIGIAIAAALAGGVYFVSVSGEGTEVIGIPAPEPVKPARPGAPRSLEEPPDRSLAPPGMLSLESDVEASVFIDGVDLERTTPLIRHPLAPGPHTVLLAHGDTVREMTVEIQSGVETKWTEPLTPAPAPVKRTTKKKRAGGR